MLLVVVLLSQDTCDALAAKVEQSYRKCTPRRFRWVCLAPSADCAGCKSFCIQSAVDALSHAMGAWHQACGLVLAAWSVSEQRHVAQADLGVVATLLFWM
jgi:hypothetical protein